MNKNWLTKKYIFLIPLFFSLFVFSQSSFTNTTATEIVAAKNDQAKLIENRKQQIRSLPDNKEKLKLILSLCDTFNRAFPPDTFYYYANLAKSISLKEKVDTSVTQCNIYIASYLLRKGLLDSSEKLIDENVALLAGNKNIVFRNNFLLLKSNILVRASKLKESLKNSFDVLTSAESIADTSAQIKAYVVIGWAFMELNQSRESENWLLKGCKQDMLSNQKYTLAVLYNNAAAVYNDLHKNDSSIFYVKIAIEIAKQKNDLTALANGYNIYAGTEIDNKNIAHAEQLLKDGLEIRKIIGDPFFIVSDMYELSEFYANNHEAAKGIALASEGIAIAEKNNLRAKLPILYEALGENYKSAGNMQKYSDVLSKIINLKDSLYVKNKAEALSEMETKYEVQKKENIIIKQKLDLTKKNNLIYGTLILLAITVLISYVIFQTRKKNQQLKMQEIVIDQKRKTMDAVMQAEENERKRIAADLHDSVAQKMVVAKLNLEVLEGYLPVLNQEQRHVYNNIFSLVDDSCTEVRNLSHSMMPQAFFQSGLTDAVKNFIDKIENKNLRISFNAEGDLENLDKNIEIMIYRIIQECLQNIIKHADASKVDISITLDNDEIDVTIEDNGVGFDTSLMEEKEGMGMKNIKSRVEFLNGQLDINSQPGNGTVVAFFVPLNKN